MSGRRVTCSPCGRLTVGAVLSYPLALLPVEGRDTRPRQKQERPERKRGRRGGKGRLRPK